MTQIQILDANFAYELTGKKNFPPAMPSVLAAGNVTMAWRDYQYQKTLQGADAAQQPWDPSEEDPFDENAPLQLPFPVTF
jgi:hypothetical protein